MSRLSQRPTQSSRWRKRTRGSEAEVSVSLNKMRHFEHVTVVSAWRRVREMCNEHTVSVRFCCLQDPHLLPLPLPTFPVKLPQTSLDNSPTSTYFGHLHQTRASRSRVRYLLGTASPNTCLQPLSNNIKRHVCQRVDRSREGISSHSPLTFKTSRC